MTKKSAQRKKRRLMSLKQVQAEKINLCRSHVLELIKQGLFPAPIKLFPESRTNYWLESSIDQFIDERSKEEHLPLAGENSGGA